MTADAIPLDTNAISDLAHQVPTVKGRLAGVSERDRGVTRVVTVGEVRFGVGPLPPGRRRDQLQARVSRVLSGFDCESVPPIAAAFYAGLKVARRQAGRAMGENDLSIAATALSLGAVSVSRDGDVPGIPGLTIEDRSA